MIPLPSRTSAGSTHARRIADAMPHPLPAGSRWLQGLSLPALTRDQAEVIMPTRKPPCRTLGDICQHQTRALLEQLLGRP